MKSNRFEHTFGTIHAYKQQVYLLSLFISQLTKPFKDLDMNLYKCVFLTMISALTCLPFGLAVSEEPQQSPAIPQTLLKLIHAPEVQAELGLKPDDDKLLALLREIDGPWWRSRILPQQKQREAVGEL
ncbi:MAG: hypothetical protein U0930_08240 [Pirellulales bacterium]